MSELSNELEPEKWFREGRGPRYKQLYRHIGGLISKGDLAVDDQRVAGIVAALKAGNTTDVVCQQINNLPLAFIAPLRANNNQCLNHSSPLSSAYLNVTMLKVLRLTPY